MKKDYLYKRLKNNKGITLVALIVTIIILLILAGIAISQLSKSGLLEKANIAKEKTDNAGKEENSILKEYEEYIDGTRQTVTIDKEIYENMQGQLTTLNTKLNELEANYNILSSQVQNFSLYPKGEKILLDSGDFSTEKTYTAPEDGWIQLKMVTAGDGAKWYDLKVGELQLVGGSSNAYLNYEDAIPCTKGQTITYRVWGVKISSSELYFIPMK